VFFTVAVFELPELTFTEPKFTDVGESCNLANGASALPVMVKETMACALLTISRRAEVFPVFEGRKVTLNWTDFEGKMTGVEGPDTVN